MFLSIETRKFKQMEAPHYWYKEFVYAFSLAMWCFFWGVFRWRWFEYQAFGWLRHQSGKFCYKF